MGGRADSGRPAMSRRCWTCDVVVEDATAARCERKHCAAKLDVERAMTSEQKKRHAEEREEAKANQNPTPWYIPRGTLGY